MIHAGHRGTAAPTACVAATPPLLRGEALEVVDRLGGREDPVGRAVEDQQLAAARLERGERRVAIGVVLAREGLHPGGIAIEVEARDRKRRIGRREELIRQRAGHQRGVGGVGRRGSPTCRASTAAIRARRCPGPRAGRRRAGGPTNPRARRTARESAEACADVRQVAVFSAGTHERRGIEPARVGRCTMPSLAPSAASHAAAMRDATRSRSSFENARLKILRPSASAGAADEVRLRVPGSGDRRAARHAHRGRAATMPSKYAG